MVWLGGSAGGLPRGGIDRVCAETRRGDADRARAAGQGLASLVVDHFGWVGFEPKHVSAGRLVGMALVGAGVVLVRIF